MEKYYTQCLMTPSTPRTYKRRGRTATHEFIYEGAVTGYLLFNSEGIKDFRSIHKAIWMLSSLFPEAREVFAVRINHGTVAASFNTSGFLVPRRIRTWGHNGEESYEFLGRQRYQGWFVDNIQDPLTKVQSFRFDDTFDRCGQLERVTDNCPCPKLQEGTCFDETLYKEFPQLRDRMADYGTAHSSVHQSDRYKNLDGYTYVPGLYTIDASFVESLRPWDNYDFSIVETRAKEFSEVGVRVAARNAHRKNECTFCVFRIGTQTHPRGCELIDKCRRHVTESEVEEVLKRWLESKTPYLTGAEGFTPHEIQYLMDISGKTYEARIFTKTKDSAVRLAGFDSTYHRGRLTFRVIPLRGLHHKAVHYPSYAALREAIPQLPAAENVPWTFYGLREMIAHAVFASRTNFWVGRNKSVFRHYIENQYGAVMGYGIHNRAQIEGPHFYGNASLAPVFNLLMGHRKTDIPEMLENGEVPGERISFDLAD